MLLLWIKAFHIVFVAAWFASMFYLPRILVNLTEVAPESTQERDRLIGMARRLYTFGSILMAVALALGFWLWMGYFKGAGGWLHAKLALVFLAVGYHHMSRGLLRVFEEGRNTKSSRWMRVFNEGAVLLFTAIVLLVVIKPF